MRDRTFVTICLLGGLFAGACNLDLAQQDSGTTPADAGTAGATADAVTGTGGAGVTAVVDAAAPIDTAGVVTGCSLLQISCPGGLSCFPFPFESNDPTITACGYPGTGDVSIPCQSQLDCDSSSICSDPGESDSVCLIRCDLSLPYCPLGSACVSLRAFPGVGACTL